MPTKLTEDMVIARTKTSDLSSVKKFNCWGSELSDISVIRRFGNVEVLSLSLNNISTLADFQCCRNLVELYVRRNDIRDLSEICYLQDLPRLRRLLLSENPCVDTAGNLYRATVLRALPNLEILDTAAVTPDEVEVAMKTGLLLEHPLQAKERSPEPVIYYERESPPSSGANLRRNSGPSDEEPVEFMRTPNIQSQQLDYFCQSENQNQKSEELTLPQPNHTSGFNNHNSKNNLIRNSNISRRDSGISPNSSDSQQSGSPPPSSCINIPESGVCYLTNSTNSQLQNKRQVSPDENGYRERTTAQRNGRRSEYSSDFDRSSQYFETETPRRIHQGSVSGRSESSRTRQRTKTSNLLSAVLCLIPELDWASLEVVELAIRRRMDEINSD